MKLIIFDLDGTLLDTLENITESVNNAMDTLACPRHSEEEVKNFIGHGADVLMERALPKNKKHLKTEALKLHLEYYDSNVCENTTPFFGVNLMLKALKKKGFTLAVYSNKGDAATRKLIDYFFPNTFAKVVGTRDYSVKKPNPTLLNEIIEELNADKKDVVYVGDSAVDVELSTNCEIPCISACWGYQSKEYLRQNGANVFAKKPQDVVKLAVKGGVKKANVMSKYKKLNQKLGLALSGGGARGFAHIGVLKAFEQENIRFDYVSGTSAGSFVAAAYCAGFSIEEITEFALSLQTGEFINTFWKLRNNAQNIERVAARLFKDMTFADLQIPFTAVAVDLVSGDEVELTEGNLAKAISASCAAPVVFTPVPLGDRILADGGLLNNMPSDVVRRMGADFVISVDLNHTRGQSSSYKDSLLSQALATWRIVMKSSVFKGQMNSDIIIEPSLKEFKSTSIDAEISKQMIDEGYTTAMERMDEIKSYLNIK